MRKSSKRLIKKHHKSSFNYYSICLFFLAIFLFGLLGWLKSSWAATLLEANWDLGSTCTTANLRSGVWTIEGDDCNGWGIGTGGPGGRNYFRVKLPPSDMTNHMHGNSSLGNPSTMYIRFWFRMNYEGGAMHPLYISEANVVDAGMAPIRSYPGTFSMITNVYSGDDTFYYDGSITRGTWYQLEYRITGGGTSSGSIFVKLDGVDITSSMKSITSGKGLNTFNGSLTLRALKYVNWETYYGQGAAGNWLDIAGMKITDGPTWIGGDQIEPPTLRIVSN